MSSLKASIEIFVATVFWGFGFVCVVWSMEGLSASAITFLRFFIAFVVGWIAVFLISPKSFAIHQHELKLSMWAGLLIGLTLILQTYGLETTTPTKSAFVTTLYVILVPLFSFLFFKEKVSSFLFFLVLLSLLGTYLLVEVEFSSFNVGDFLTFANAITASFHILYMNSMSRKTKSPFLFNVYQCLWASVFTLPLFFFSSRWSFSALTWKGYLGLVSLALGSSLLAFYLQLRAQKDLSPTRASLLFLLESPIALIFSFWLLKERLGTFQWAGVIIIFTSCALTVLVQNSKKNS